MTHDLRRRDHGLTPSLWTEKGDVLGQKRQPRGRASVEDKSKSKQTFEDMITSAFTVMREDLEIIARDTNTYGDEILDLVGQLEGLHLCRHAGFRTIKEHPKTNKEKFDSLFSTYSSLLSDLGPWRMQAIQAGEEAIQVQSIRMRESRKNMMNAAKRRLDEGREKQQLATDASELMKHYKALIMAA